MTFFKRTLFLIAIVTATVTAEIPSCRAMKQDATQCDPYVTSFVKITQLKKERASLRRRPVTEREMPMEEKIRVKNGMTLHNLVSKYIKREERFYNRAEREKRHHAETEAPKEQPQKTVPKATIHVPLTKETTKPSQTTSQKEIQKKTEKKPEQSSGKPKPYIPPKTVVLVPATKPIAVVPDTTEENRSNDIQPPAEIILPAEVSAPPKNKQKDVSKNPQAEYAVYRVKKGDSLLGIAKRFGVEAKILIEINQLHESTALKAGQKLRIPLSQEDTDAIENATYIVKKGDTLSRIARHFRVKLSDLKKYNKIRKKSVIHIGQILVLPLPWKLVELKRIEAQKRKAALKKKRERERLARIALKKAERARFLKLSKGLKHKLSVTATAYTSHHSQTDRTPFLAAWNNRIRPGMKIIAVSRDLIYKYGITNGKKVRISGLPGIYTVRDKMNKKWRRKIDIYMGTSRWRALRWGRRRVTLYY